MTFSVRHSHLQRLLISLSENRDERHWTRWDCALKRLHQTRWGWNDTRSWFVYASCVCFLFASCVCVCVRARVCPGVCKHFTTVDHRIDQKTPAFISQNVKSNKDTMITKTRQIKIQLYSTLCFVGLFGLQSTGVVHAGGLRRNQGRRLPIHSIAHCSSVCWTDCFTNNCRPDC